MTTGKLLIGGALLLAGVSAAALYVPAQQARSFVERSAQRIAEPGALRIEPEELQRGWDHSTLTTRISLPLPPLPPDQAAPDPDDLQFILLHRIGHVPHWSEAGPVYPMETVLDPDDPRQPAWVRDSGIAEAFQARTLLRLDGSTETQLELKAAERRFRDGGSLSWSGLHGEIVMNPELTQILGYGDLGSLQMRFPDGRLALGNVNFRFDLHQDETGLWFGEQAFEGGPFVMHSQSHAGELQALQLESFSLDVDSESRASGLAASLALTLTDMRVDDFTLQKLVFDTTMADIPPGPVLVMRDLGIRMQQDPGAFAAEPQQINTLMLEQLLAILQAGPRLQIQPLRLDTGLGHFQMEVDLRMAGGADSAALHPLALLQSLDARVDLSASPELFHAMLVRQNRARLEQLLTASGQELPAEEELAARAEAAAEQQLTGWQQLGFLELRDEELTSTLELRRGELRVNGVAMGPVQPPGIAAP